MVCTPGIFVQPNVSSQKRVIFSGILNANLPKVATYLKTFQRRLISTGNDCKPSLSCHLYKCFMDYLYVLTVVWTRPLTVLKLRLRFPVCGLRLIAHGLQKKLRLLYEYLMLLCSGLYCYTVLDQFRCCVLCMLHSPTCCLPLPAIRRSSSYY